MGFTTELLTLMDSTIKISTRTAHSNYGEPTFTGSTTSYRARIVHKPGYMRDATDEDVAYQHVLWVRSTGAVSITASDRLTLPDGSTPPILSVERYPDETGPHHVVIHTGY